jgi:hypothetical protein
MRKKRFLYLGLAFWELVRLVLLVFMITEAVLGAFVSSSETLLLFLLLGSGNLLVPAGALFLYFSEKKSPAMSFLLIAGKIIELFPCFLVLLFFLSSFIEIFSSSALLRQTLMEGIILLAIFAIDLLFLIILLSFKGGTEEKTLQETPPEEKLPEYKETEILTKHD